MQLLLSAHVSNTMSGNTTFLIRTLLLKQLCAIHWKEKQGSVFVASGQSYVEDAKQIP